MNRVDGVFKGIQHWPDSTPTKFEGGFILDYRSFTLEFSMTRIEPMLSPFENPTLPVQRMNMPKKLRGEMMIISKNTWKNVSEH